MTMIRPDSLVTVKAAPAPRARFRGLLMLALGLSLFLIVALTGFTVAVMMIWPG